MEAVLVPMHFQSGINEEYARDQENHIIGYIESDMKDIMGEFKSPKKGI